MARPRNKIKLTQWCTKSGQHRRIRLYSVWCAMVQRCYVATHKSYHNYGGRGITVCNTWRRDFQAFRKWAIKSGYRKGLTLDRIDNNDGYMPKNCKWATPQEQGGNRRDNMLIAFNGKTQCLKAWARDLGISRASLKYRLKHWSRERALTQPRGDWKENKIEFEGETLSLSQWARRIGISKGGLIWRLKNWSLPDALTKPCTPEVFK